MYNLNLGSVAVNGGQKRVPIVFVLDTSSSMRGEGFAQMKKAFVSIIQGKISLG